MAASVIKLLDYYNIEQQAYLASQYADAKIQQAVHGVQINIIIWVCRDLCRSEIVHCVGT